MKAFSLSLLLSVLVVAAAQAQTPAPAKTRANYTLQQQFSNLKYRSSTQIQYNQPYKVVKQANLDAFFQNVQDTLRARQQSIRNAAKETAAKLAATQQELEKQKAQVQALQEVNAQKDRQIQQGAHDVASLSVLGLDMNKQVYVIISLLAIVALGIVTAVFAYLYKNSNNVTQEKIRAYDELTEEFKNHKQLAREKEVKLKRDHQSEANKVEELKQELAELRKRVAM
ncbi:hypothetical protein [Rufibacter psychrotolerans]|uniref:hypothetical protein n=1 Tax=Rufibacter psychrotolerans TaxID=2812556 RepID=UPI001966E8DA|nr:hypothetical protein [Rufibacter sp. SYSU D00308]